MKSLILLILIFCFPALAQQTRSDSANVLKDIRLVCELSKLGQTLLNTPEFKNDKAMVAFRLSEMLQATLKTEEAKAAYKGLSMGDRKSKREGWKKVATASGAKNWDCPSLGEIGG